MNRDLKKPLQQKMPGPESSCNARRRIKRVWQWRRRKRGIIRK
jgi:hypothetical protein